MMFNLQTSSTTMKLLLLVFPLLCFEVTFGDISEPNVIKVTVEEGSDVILPCSLSSKESIMFQLFVWTRDHQKTVFVHYPYFHNRYGYPTQDEEFIGRVSHFEDELKSGNASIIIRNTEVADSGDYTCDFPQLQPRQIFHIKLLVVEPNVIKVIVEEGSDVILPCSLSSKENIMFQLFEWNKDDQKQVFKYDGGFHSNKGNPGQDEQFIERVSHFKDGLMSGNASIIIRHTEVADSGVYTCEFPRHQPRQIFYIKLVVDSILRDRTAENIPGAATKPYVKTLNQTQYWALLQCEVRGSFPKPKLRWQDSDGNILHAEEPKVTERGGRYDIILNITVTKTNNYRCVATQEEINHQIYSEIYMYIYGGMLKDRRAENIPGTAPKPSVTPLKQTMNWALLQCEVRGALPKPKLHWQDSDGNILHAEEPKVTERRGRYNVILQINVTKTNNYRCVATQEKIKHQVDAEMYMLVFGGISKDNSVSGSCYQWMIPFIILSALCCYFICVLLALKWKGYITLPCKKDRGAAGPHNQQEAVQLNTRREAV
ncbi:hemicentin-1-like isoform X8 [Thunnus thynnus]|uniref:hemicentin-1-like isoform X8 n=1 Tax=Thunnus thynnus TaxID=8237 RepID=UPI003526D0EE